LHYRFKEKINMKIHSFYLVLLIGALAVVWVTDVSAQANKRLGTAGASELLVPVGARDLAMGNAGVASSRGVEALYWNPAGVSRMSSTAEGMFSYMKYIADINLNYAAVAASFKDIGTFAFSFKAFDFGDISLTTEDDSEGRAGRTYTPTYTTLGVGYSRALTDAISAGVNLKLISERIDLVNASGVAFDVGVQYTQLAGLKGVGLGVAVKNIGPQMKFDGTGLLRDALPSGTRRPEQKLKSDAASFELPSSIEIGLSYDYLIGENYVFRASGAFANNNLAENEYHLGGELGYMASGLQFFGRGGYTIAENNDNDINPFGATLGAGLVYKAPGINVTIDYAWRDVKFFEANNIFSLKLGF
jgi:hypothetical protein